MVVKGKCLSQEVWREKVWWDTPWDDYFTQEWAKFKEEYLHATSVPW